MNEKKIALITDSACDISDEELEKYNIRVIPLRICFSDRTYRDKTELNSNEIYNMIKTEIPKSSLPSSEDIEAIFDELASENVTDVIYVGISSGLSGSYNFIKVLGEERKDFNMHAFDTKTLSLGQGMLVIYAAKMLEDGKDIKEIMDGLQAVRDKMSAFFVLRTLTYLAKGGRIGKVAGTVGSLLNLCPVITVNKDGVYEAAAKTIGYKRVVELMFAEFSKRFSGKNISVSIVHGMEEDAAKLLLNRIKEVSNVVESRISSVTAVLGVHTGPGLLGVIAYPI